MSAIIPAVVSASGEDTPIVLFPTVPDLVWSAIVIVLIFIVMYAFVIPTFTRTLDARNAEIERGVEMSKKAEDVLAEAHTKAEATVAQAREEAARIRSQAQEQALKTIAAAKEQASAEAQRIVEAADRQIEANRQAAEISLRTDVGMLASELAERIVGEHLADTDLSARVIDRFLDSLEVEAPQKG